MNEEKRYSEGELKLARLAAYIDGEGTIGIGKQKRGSWESFSLRMKVGITDQRLADWLRQNFGGNANKKNRRRRIGRLFLYGTFLGEQLISFYEK